MSEPNYMESKVYSRYHCYNCNTWLYEGDYKRLPRNKTQCLKCGSDNVLLVRI